VLTIYAALPLRQTDPSCLTACVIQGFQNTQLIYIHPEDGNCNVCWNVSINFNILRDSVPKAEVPRWNPAIKTTDKNTIKIIPKWKDEGKDTNIGLYGLIPCI
jgi:hypothetical protein